MTIIEQLEQIAQNISSIHEQHDTEIWSDDFITRFFARAEELGLFSPNPTITEELKPFLITDLSNDWTFMKGNETSTVSLPHTCNTSDGLTSSYYRGKTSYSKYISANGTREYYLLVEGAGQMSEVFVDNSSVYSYYGGYTHYIVPLGKLFEGNHLIKIECDNSLNFNNIPISADFNFNNGLHRKVWLLGLGSAGFDPVTYGQDRFHLTQDNVTTNQAAFTVKTSVLTRNELPYKVIFTLKDGSNNEVLKDETVIPASSETYNYSKEFLISNPNLWNGKKNPYLYTAKLELYQNDTLIDCTDTKIGFRFFSIDADRGFILNGEEYPLRGVCVHQDYHEHMSAMTEADFDTDYNLISEIGATVVRLAHYPHSQYAFKKCDELGLVVQTEIPWVNDCGVNATEEYFNNIKTNFESMIRNYYNHPSIIFWGMSNELEMEGLKASVNQQGEYSYTKARDWTNELYAYGKTLDSKRLIGFVTQEMTFKDKARPDVSSRDNIPEWNADWIGTNQYRGWYGDNTFESLTTLLGLYRQKRSSWALSEYGAGANPATHSDDPTTTTNKGTGGARHDEEYQNLFHESYLEQIQAKPWLVFTTVWIMFDFAVAGRNEGGIPYINDKGLMTRDRQTKKDCFYLYKAAWTNEPVCYVTSRRFETRTNENIPVKVYSNLDNLTLTIDGIEKQTLNTPDKCGVVWNFANQTLENGSHTITVTGTKNGQTYSDTVTWEVNVQTIPLTIAEQPQDVTCAVGASTSFSVTATGGVPPYNYRWQYASAKNPDTWSNATGQDDGTSRIFVTNNRDMTHQGARYRCQITDSVGTVVYSNAATITMVTAATEFSLGGYFLGALERLDTTLLNTVSTPVTFTPANGSIEGLTWTVTPSNVASIVFENNILTITALEAGTATLTGSLPYGATHEFTITVSALNSPFKLEYNFANGNTVPIISDPSAPDLLYMAQTSGNINSSEEGFIPTVTYGADSVIIPLEQIINNYEYVDIDIDFGQLLENSAFDGLCKLVDFSNAQDLSATNFEIRDIDSHPERYNIRVGYQGIDKWQTVYNPYGTNLARNSSQHRISYRINTVSNTAVASFYGGDTMYDRGSVNMECPRLSEITSLYIANSKTLNGSVQIPIRGCVIRAWGSKDPELEL